MKLKFLVLISCLLFLANNSFAAPTEERKQLLKKLPIEQRKIVQQIDEATAHTQISEIHFKKERLWQVKKAYARYVTSKK